MTNKNKIIYSLSVVDLQSVALDSIERELTDEEIKKVTNEIEKSINWYEIIENVIDLNIKEE
ncbi:MAG: hypothetical protein ABR980_14620 [Ignavibacteriaceae bacterium]|jgi:hypothetical protein